MYAVPQAIFEEPQMVTNSEVISFISPVGCVGGGISADGLAEGMKQKPAFIACDAGSSDPGPYFLGHGLAAFTREAVKRDMQLMLVAARAAKIPLIVGSAGTAGGDVHVDWLIEIVREVVAEQELTFRMATIYSEQPKSYLHELLATERLLPLDSAPHVDAGVIDRSSRVVGMMGVEPLQEALREGAEVIIAGRASDPSLFAAIPIMRGFPEGLCWHAGKMSECGSLVCEELGKGIIFTTISREDVTIRPYGGGLRCTPQSVAAHSLYESSNPFLHRECSGTFDLTDSTFEVMDEVTVRVRGTTFHKDRYTVKLEGAELVGYQSIIIGGIRDPFIIRQLDSWLDKVRRYALESVRKVLGEAADESQYSIRFHRYGLDAVMNTLEPQAGELPHEVGLVLEATAPTQEFAHKLAELCRQPLLHCPIPEWTGSITGFACLHNPAVIDRGPVYRFCLNHVAVPASPTEMFRTHFTDMDGGKDL